MNATQQKIVVLGAGYTGMLAAIRLAHRTRRGGAEITLVNASAQFTERMRTHQTASGQDIPGHDIAGLLTGTGVRFVQGRATAIDPARRTVAVDGVGTLPYDRLVYALGSTTDTSAVPGADEHAYTLDGPAATSAAAFAARIAGLAPGARVAVCGGGLTGIEAATEIAEQNPHLKVTLISRGEVGSMMGGKARAHLHRALERLDVQVRTGAGIAKILPDAVQLSGGELLPFDACLWTAGVKVPRLAADAGIAVDGKGLILVDATLKSRSHPEIRAIGDAAAVDMAWGPIHGTCQSGLPTAAYAADAIARELRGKQVKPFRFGYFHQPVSLGRKDAVIQFTRADDTPGRFCLTGKSAVMYKNTVTGSPVTTFRLSRKMNMSVQLSKGGRATRKPAAPVTGPVAAA
ncbi:NAD(P)/FAD-dependent oxidoreductase [Yinghuangia soli]|uniref:FAD-dependent oxidoreductase n=1 Tax=Yinghuangia soli TaxID=2908204 RepID=A0AA41PY34_9ACTN|nr:FAD-dependent oxidoreductase [Yinghuangia soli]MCF2526587.1 FAD-dependent oxidoreductase [Yinghuangia soli]